MKKLCLLISSFFLASLALTLSSCVSSSPNKKSDSPDKKSSELKQDENTATLNCNYSSDSNASDDYNLQLQIDYGNSNVVETQGGNVVLSANAALSPDYIQYETKKTENMDLDTRILSYTVTTTTQINRKTLGLTRSSVMQFAGQDNPEDTWSFIGSCEKIVQSSEGNKI